MSLPHLARVHLRFRLRVGNPCSDGTRPFYERRIATSRSRSSALLLKEIFHATESVRIGAGRIEHCMQLSCRDLEFPISFASQSTKVSFSNERLTIMRGLSVRCSIVLSA
jgi:hypothetical protein